ncbi:PAS domain S-box protein [Clostridium saccharoperbutylacetonicum]|uniref:PAS domain S-box protein n=1 Tax=Clostridium saccharoperbutylacetonicum TaxID=36745 RepID=UPI000983FA88|nr:PAS domain S-box protein [Clostridium saccharoperbutylacetonicum]AQR96385.1 sensor histidine kinase TmoS [Clostridium saccharoperbutylacetonicum]NSB32258.1 PAS domain S-box-containing protein [Clostridium saccharoperbutylacetonicum]
MKILFDLIPNPMFYKDVDGKYLWCNKAFENALGLEREDIIGKTDYEITSKDIADLFSELDKSIKRNKETSFYESSILHADGLMYDTIVSRTPNINENNEAVGVLGIVTDITEQKRIEKELKFAQSKMEVLLNSGPQLIFILDSEFKIHAFNRNASKFAKDLYGLSLNEGDYILKFLSDDLFERFKNNLKKALNGEEVQSEENLIESNGNELWMQIYYSPISHETVDEKLVCITCVPITERKIAEKRLYKQLRFQEMLVDISTNFVSKIDISEGINEALKNMGSLSGADRVYIFINNYEKETTSNVYEWCAEGITPQIKFLQDIPFETIPWWMKKIVNGETINIVDIYLMPTDAAKEKELFEQQDIKSLLVLPIYCDKKVIGFIGFDSVKRKKDWDDANLYLLKLSSEIIGNAFERQNNEMALTDSEEKYRELFDNGNSCIFVNKFIENTLIGDFIEINKLACDKLGYSKYEFKELSFFNLLENKELYLEKLSKALKEENYIIEADIKRKDNTIIPFEIRIHVFSLQDEKVILTVANDISKGKEANKKIKQLSLAIENSPSSVVITDITGKFEYVNPKFSELTGYSFEEIEGKKINILKSGYHDRDFYSKLWREIISGNEWSGEFYNKRKDCSKYWEHTSIAPLKNDEGKITNFISVREDITHRKVMEEELKESNDELKETIDKLKVTQSQLIQQEKLAGIGQLAAGVAHEINNPLGFVTSNFDTLKKYTGKLKELIYNYKELVEKIKIEDMNLTEDELEKIKELDKNEIVEYILSDLEALFNESEDGINRVISIVKGLKWFAYEDDSIEFDMYDLNHGIKNTLIVTKNEIKYIAEVVEEYDTELPLIEANGQKINQVLLNIILNSVYAIKDKESEEFGEISIKTYKNNEFVFCEINDTGTGIKEEIINKIFDPFFTTKPIGKGTGLGLNIAYDIIVNVHKGNISCENNKKGGACFKIRLPIRKHNTNNE